jgi:hypothetical protein
MQQFSEVPLSTWRQRASVLAALLVLGVMTALPAQALPLFARQTGFACNSCHVVYPELTHMGRMFKLNGYQLDNGKDLQFTEDDGELRLGLPAIPNLALFIMSGYVSLGKAVPDSLVAGAHSTSSGIQFPQQISLLWGGKIAPHFGAFAQVTYDSTNDSFSIDNTDMRFAWQFVLPNLTPLTLGLSINNNPTIEDAWNTTPAFGYPYLPPEIGVGSLASPQINAQQAYAVAGPVFYALWNEQVYVAGGFYRAAPVGQTNPVTGTIAPYDSTYAGLVNGNNPYWRLAYEYDFDRYAASIGTYGAYFKIYPGGGAPQTGPTNNYTDIAEDIQIQFVGEVHQATYQITYVKENQSLDASSAVGASNPTDWLSYLQTNITYWYKRKYGGDIGYLTTKGSTDHLLYPSAPTTCVSGACGQSVAPGTPGSVTVGTTNSATSNPGTDAYVAELFWAPWLNLKIGLQYTHYTKFNGAKNNYDGLGRNAADNDTTYLQMWFAL